MSKQANCFTVRRHGYVSQGIALESDAQGNAVLKVGTHWFNRDRFSGAVLDTEYAVPTVSRAVLCERGGNGKRKFFTLREPASTRPTTLLIKTYLGLPLNAVVKVSERELHVSTGMYGGQVMKHDGQEVLVSLEEGKEVDFLFSDGWVRTFRNRDGSLSEVPLSAEDMLIARIMYAHCELANARTFFDTTLREKRIRTIHSGMADLLHLTVHADNGQALRIKLLSDFFLSVSRDELGLVHRKLTAILHEVDRALLSMLLAFNHDADATRHMASVVSINDARTTALRAQKRAARAAHDRDVRNGMKGHQGAKPAVSSGKKGKK